MFTRLTKLLILSALALSVCAQKIDFIRQVQNKPEFDVREYNWSRTSGAGASGTLTSTGSKTITLTVCPKGLAVGYSAYISGGTGTAEAVSVTATTCSLAGGSAGTVTVTTANTHSGSWVVGTATAGFQEAVNAATSIGVNPATITAVPATYDFYAAVAVKGSRTSIVGLGGRGLARIVQHHITDSVFVFDPGTTTYQTENTIKGFALVPGGGKTGGWGVEATYQYYFELSDLMIDTIPSGVLLSDSQSVWFSKSAIRSFAWGAGIGVKITGTGTGVDNYYFNDLEIVGGPGLTSTAAACINIQTGGGFFFTNVTGYDCGIAGMYVNPASGNEVRWGFVTGSNFDSGLGDGILFEPSGTGVIKSWSFSNSWAATNSGDGFKSVGTAGGLIKGLNFQGFRAFGNGLNGATFGTGTSDILVTGSKAAGNSTASAGVHAGFAFINGVSGFSITSSHSGPYDSFTNLQGRGIYVDTASSNNYTISNNTLLGNSIALEDQGTGTTKVIEHNLVPNADRYTTVASAATITLPARDESTIFISGTTAIQTMSPTWGGRKVKLIFTSATPGGVGTGGTSGKDFAKTASATQNTPMDCEWTNSQWYCN